MSIKINFKNSTQKNRLNNLVLFTDEKFNINPLKNYLSNSEFSYIGDLLKSSDLNKNLFMFEINAKKKLSLFQ